jgi:hypothetical protein
VVSEQRAAQRSIGGALRDHPAAADLAGEVARVHHRFASEVVAHFRLCPFLHDPATAFGRFCVMLDREPDVASAADEVEKAGLSVVHLVYPLTTLEVTPFEQFGNRVHLEVARRMRSAPVHATFHPGMQGDSRSAARLVGLLRRAPDPFVQFVPEGLHVGGTTYMDPSAFELGALAGSNAKPGATPAEHNFDRLSVEDLATIAARQRDIAADRDRSYAPYLDAMRIDAPA